MGCCWNPLYVPLLMAGPKPLLTELDIHHSSIRQAWVFNPIWCKINLDREDTCVKAQQIDLSNQSARINLQTREDLQLLMTSDVGNDCTSVEIWGEIGINDRRIWLATKWPQLLLQQKKQKNKWKEKSAKNFYGNKCVFTRFLQELTQRRGRCVQWTYV